MNDTLKKCIIECQLMTRKNFDFLYLAIFFTNLSRKINFSRIANSIRIDEPSQGQGYTLNGIRISNLLEDIYANPPKKDPLFELAVINSIRGISMAVRESIKNDDFMKIVKKDIFQDNENHYKNFEAVVRFIRNNLSHNIQENIILKKSDFDDQKSYWLNNNKIDKVEFTYDYSSPQSSIYLQEYALKFSISWLWQDISEGKPYLDIINVYQNLVFSEFCNNMVYKLYESYIIPNNGILP